ncbi:hypothetical protein GCM10010404_41420 [Nonomuraea africana]
MAAVPQKEASCACCPHPCGGGAACGHGVFTLSVSAGGASGAAPWAPLLLGAETGKDDRVSLTGETLSYLSGPGVGATPARAACTRLARRRLAWAILTTLTSSGADVAGETGETAVIHRESGG